MAYTMMNDHLWQYDWYNQNVRRRKNHLRYLQDVIDISDMFNVYVMLLKIDKVLSFFTSFFLNFMSTVHNVCHVTSK